MNERFVKTLNVKLEKNCIAYIHFIMKKNLTTGLDARAENVDQVQQLRKTTTILYSRHLENYWETISFVGHSEGLGSRNFIQI